MPVRTVYRCSDGKEFETLPDAEEYEGLIVLKLGFLDWVKKHIPKYTSIQAQHRIATALVSGKEELKELLNKL